SCLPAGGMSLESASERERERERGMGTGREWAPGKGREKATVWAPEKATEWAPGKGREKATVWAPDRWGPGGEDPG
ncbi:MAG: hypothetical protein ACRDJK_05015, partial [Actinomycetota bacterium]